MAYTQTNWQNEAPSGPLRFSIHGDVEGVISDSAEIVLVTPTTPGTPMNAANLNHMEQGIADAHTLAAAAQSTANSKLLLTTPGVSPWTNASYNGGAVVAGTYTFATANAFNAAIPATAKGIFVYLSATWASASAGNIACLRPTGSGANGARVRAQTANFPMEIGPVFVPCNASFDLQVVGNTTALLIEVWGYLS